MERPSTFEFVPAKPGMSGVNPSTVYKRRYQRIKGGGIRLSPDIVEDVNLSQKGLYKKSELLGSAKSKPKEQLIESTKDLSSAKSKPKEQLIESTKNLNGSLTPDKLIEGAKQKKIRTISGKDLSSAIIDNKFNERGFSIRKIVIYYEQK